MKLRSRDVNCPKLRLALLLLLCRPMCALADTAPVTLMHRIDAGAFDARGWALAESTNGGFSVQMPGPFSDFSVHGDPEGIADHLEGIGGKAPNGIVFTALKLIYKNAQVAAAEFEKFKAGEGFPTPRINPVTVAGLEAVDISYGDDMSSADVRVIHNGQNVYTLTVEWPAGKAAPALALYQPFIQSFRILPNSAPRVEEPTIWQHDQLNQTFMRTISKDMCMKKTLATLSRAGCATKQCLVNVGGATADCITWAVGDKAEFCATYPARYSQSACDAGGLDAKRCALLDEVRRGVCAAPAGK